MLRGILLVALLGTARTRGCTQTQPKTQFNIAIFLYQGVELLDFLRRPGEAFSATPGFNVYTVSADGKQLVSQGFVTIQPQYSIDNAPIPDIVVFPGGEVHETSKNQKIIDWANSLVAKGTIGMSVCNGAYILAKTGLLNGLTITTHHGAIEGLRKLLPQSTILDNAKYVDNGNIITAAGVSSGIEGALHMISRIKGRDIAKAVAWYMEYNKWKPEEGLSLYKNPALSPGSGLIPYEGELKNLAMDLYEKGQYSEAANLMQQAIKWYPTSASCYNILGASYSKAANAPEATKAYTKLLELDPKSEEARVYLAQPLNK